MKKINILIMTATFSIGSCQQNYRIDGQEILEQLSLSDNGRTNVIKEFPENFPETLIARGEPIVYTKENSNNFEYIGMPIGGIGAGQLYIGGDGKLWFWDIFNTNYKIGQLKGEEAYEFPYMRSEEGQYGTIDVEQGFAVKVKTKSGTIIKNLDRNDISDIEFNGQYPIANISYKDEKLPVSIALESFSPFSPLELESSSYPATIFNFSVKNISNFEVNVELGGWLENAALVESRKKMDGQLVNRIQQGKFAALELFGSAESKSIPQDSLILKYDYGTMGLTLLEGGNDSYGITNIEISDLPASVFAHSYEIEAKSELNKKPLIGGLVKKFALKPGETKQVNYLLSWHFPNSRVAIMANEKGKSYNNRFKNATDVSEDIVANFEELTSKTKLWRETWYDSTLPYWFLDRTFLNTSILASSTSHIFENGQFYGFEGGYQGPGTCTHVWGYGQAMGRLFPELEISLREHTDFSPFPKGGLMASGIVNFRGSTGEGWVNGLAVDGQSGIILRSYLTHQTSSDKSFLKRNYVSIKTVMNGLIEARDADHDGILTGPQHNTLDADWYGKITWLSLYYTTALRTTAAMADEMGDTEYANFCRKTADKGRQYIEEHLFNGEYFFHEADPEHPTSPGTFTGCEYSQLLGQSWAYQVGLGDVVDTDKAKTALESLWKYNFSTDVGPFREIQKGGRWYALPGEGGLIACTWPLGGSEVLDKGRKRYADYNNECQNGYEYAATSLMMWEGMPYHSLAHIWYMHNNRYIGSKRNPWCEVEWGIHYSRSMASYGHFVAASGFEYHGPKEYMAFSPKITQEKFKSAFTAAEGWGTFEQTRTDRSQNASIHIKHGKLKLSTLDFDISGGWKPRNVIVVLNGKEELKNKFSMVGNRVSIEFPESQELKENQVLKIKIKN